MMAAAHAGPGVLLVDHARAPGEKIRISGGGRCNFTNMDVGANNYLSENPHFCKSALARYSQWDFIEMVSRHGIAWHEKTLGQLFCDGKATQIVDMLQAEMAKAVAEVWLQTRVVDLRHADGRFDLRLDREGRTFDVSAENLVLATGGKSIPKMGATGLAYEIARQFGHDVTDTRAALVPFTFDKGRFADLAGVSLPSALSNERARFSEGLLFTHRGLSGPAVLQLSSYWLEGEEIVVDLLPGVDCIGALKSARQAQGRRSLTTELGHMMPGKVVSFLGQHMDFKGNLADLSDQRIAALSDALHHWRLKPTGTEGYRTAEVTLGGISTSGLDSKTLMSKHLPGLFAIGEAVDVTGWLGGYNFQWAWSSGVAAGQAIIARHDG